MKKLYLLLDTWNNEKTFLGSELDLIKEKFDLCIICNDFKGKETAEYPNNVNFYFYDKIRGLKSLLYAIKFFFDRESYNEIKNLKDENDKLNKFSEIIRFYINAELFYDYLKKNKLVEHEENAIYYTYWYFWKCFALTKHKKKLGSSRIITRTHEYDLYNVSIPSGYQPFKRIMDKNIDKIIFIAEHGFRYYLDKYGFEKSSKYILNHLGTIDYKKLNPYKKQDKLVLVSCASVIERKRVGLIIDALVYIDGINIEWTHFGTGDLFDTIYQYAKEKLSDKTNISYCLNGQTAHEDIMNFYAKNSVDIFLMTSVSEGNPVSVMEAMSFGIPIISAGICNMPNMIKGNGILLSENPEPREIADAIIRIAKADAAETNAMREKSREIWEDNYRADINNRKFVEEVLLNL